MRAVREGEHRLARQPSPAQPAHEVDAGLGFVADDAGREVVSRVDGPRRPRRRTAAELLYQRWKAGRQGTAGSYGWSHRAC